ncbi:hypothetical protein B7463_g11592, partial [Scytalidium lignicola]
MSLTEDLDDYKLDSEFQFEPEIILHRSYHADRGRGRHRVVVEEKWVPQKPPLGAGSFGIVRLERRQDVDGGGGKYESRAVKQPRKFDLTRMRVDFRKELLALTKFSRTKAFVEFFGWFENDDYIFIAMEYFSHGTLDKFISTLTERDVQIITLQVLEGVRIMHEERFAHRDLKPQNIFVVQKSPNWWVKIGDFGISKRVANNETALRTNTGTPNYTAPEIFHYVSLEDDESEAYTNAVDIWSLGCMVYEMLALQVPFIDWPKNLVAYCNGGPFPDAPLKARATTHAINFVSHILTPLPYQRPTAQEALNSSWFQIEFPNLLHTTGGSKVKERYNAGSDDTLKPTSSYGSSTLTLRPSFECVKKDTTLSSSSNSNQTSHTSQKEDRSYNLNLFSRGTRKEVPSGGATRKKQSEPEVRSVTHSKQEETRDKEKKRGLENSSHHAYVEEVDSDEYTPTPPKSNNKSARRMEEEIRTRNDEARERLRDNEPICTPNWDDHKEYAAQYLQAARQKGLVKSSDEAKGWERDNEPIRRSREKSRLKLDKRDDYIVPLALRSKVKPPHSYSSALPDIPAYPPARLYWQQSGYPSQQPPYTTPPSHSPSMQSQYPRKVSVPPIAHADSSRGSRRERSIEFDSESDSSSESEFNSRIYTSQRSANSPHVSNSRTTPIPHQSDYQDDGYWSDHGVSPLSSPTRLTTKWTSSGRQGHYQTFDGREQEPIVMPVHPKKSPHESGHRSSASRGLPPLYNPQEPHYGPADVVYTTLPRNNESERDLEHQKSQTTKRTSSGRKAFIYENKVVNI